MSKSDLGSQKKKIARELLARQLISGINIIDAQKLFPSVKMYLFNNTQVNDFHNHISKNKRVKSNSSMAVWTNTSGNVFIVTHMLKHINMHN